MALDYKQSSELRINPIFMGRIGTAALRWSSSILSNSSLDISTGTARRKIKFAEDVYANPVIQAQKLQPGVVQDPAVQSEDIDPNNGDSTITDPALQSAVEATIDKII
jgi:hypothetical protein